MINCEGGRREEVRPGALMKMMEALETQGGWCFQVKHVRGVDSRLADRITRWKREENKK